jgi:hypothetical protein
MTMRQSSIRPATKRWLLDREWRQQGRPPAKARGGNAENVHSEGVVDSAKPLGWDELLSKRDGGDIAQFHRDCFEGIRTYCDGGLEFAAKIMYPAAAVKPARTMGRPGPKRRWARWARGYRHVSNRSHREKQPVAGG